MRKEELEEAFSFHIFEIDRKKLKTVFPEKQIFSGKKLAYSYDYFNIIDVYQKPVSNFKKEDFFSKLKNACPIDEDIERTKEIFELFNMKNGAYLTHLHLKTDVMLLTWVLGKFIKVSMIEFDINPFFCVSLPDFSCLYGLNYTGINMHTLQSKELILLLENIIDRGTSSVMGDRCVNTDRYEKCYISMLIVYVIGL